MKLLLFGGTFDPPHYGHISLLKNAIRAVRPDHVVVMVAGVPPHKQGTATPGGLRLAMCRCFSPLFPGLELSDLELRRPGKSYTFDTVRALQAQHPGARLYLCLGGDMLLGFRQWKHWRALLAQVVLVVQDREGGGEQPLRRAAAGLEAEGGRVLFSGGEVEAVSSSELRAAIAAGADPLALLPPPAGRIVQQRQLYRPPLPGGR